MMEQSILAWHFTTDKLRDGSPIPSRGEWLVYEGRLRMCESGLHASRRIRDALDYAPGNIVHLVECGGVVIEGNDKLVCSRRRIIFSANMEERLGLYARLCALDCIHLWEAPSIVRDFLETGDGDKEAAEAAAAEAARSAAARTAAEAAAWSAAAAVWSEAAAEAEAARTAAAVAEAAAVWSEAAAEAEAAAVAQNDLLESLAIAVMQDLGFDLDEYFENGL